MKAFWRPKGPPVLSEGVLEPPWNLQRVPSARGDASGGHPGGEALENPNNANPQSHLVTVGHTKPLSFSACGTVLGRQDLTEITPHAYATGSACFSKNGKAPQASICLSVRPYIVEVGGKTRGEALG